MDWASAEAFYQKFNDAQRLEVRAQPAKDQIYILDALDIDQVGGGFILAYDKIRRTRWVLVPDDPHALDEKIFSGLLIHVVGTFEGNKPFELVSGASANLPILRMFAADTTFGFRNSEDPSAPWASGEITNTVRAERDAALRAEKEAQKDGSENHQVAENGLRKSLSSPLTVQGTSSSAANVNPISPTGASNNLDSDLLPRARAQLAEVNSKIDSQRKRYAEAKDVINTLTKNKTVPVKEGSQPYYRCLAASKVINEIEEGAPALKAEQAKLETLVNELEKADSALSR